MAIAGLAVASCHLLSNPQHATHPALRIPTSSMRTCGCIPLLILTHDCRYVTVALAVAHYYWTRGNSDVMPRFPVVHAARTTLRWSIVSTCHSNTAPVILLGGFTVVPFDFKLQMANLHMAAAAELSLK